MTPEPNRPRGFEDRLLSELTTYVSERNQNMTDVEESPQKASRFSRGKKFSLAGAVGAAALGIGAIVALPALTASPAYAVERKDDGNVYIEVRNPEDAAGLEETLAEHGIKAHVDFPPKGMMCEPGRYTPDDDAMLSGMEANAGSDEDGLVLGFDVNPDSYPLDGDRTLVIEVSKGFFADEETNFAALLGLGAAKGEIGQCNPVPVEELEIVEGENEETGGDAEEAEKSTNSKKDDDGSKDKD